MFKELIMLINKSNNIFVRTTNQSIVLERPESGNHRNGFLTEHTFLVHLYSQLAYYKTLIQILVVLDTNEWLILLENV